MSRGGGGGAAGLLKVLLGKQPVKFMFRGGETGASRGVSGQGRGRRGWCAAHSIAGRQGKAGGVRKHTADPSHAATNPDTPSPTVIDPLTQPC